MIKAIAIITCIVIVIVIFGGGMKEAR